MKGKFLSVLLTVALLATVFAFPASARTPYVGTANSLRVYLVSPSGQRELAREYSLSDLNAIAFGEGVFYSSIDAMPATVLTIADGVYMRDLITDLEDRGFEVGNFHQLILRAPDGWQRSFSYDELFQRRYYFPGLFTATLENGRANPMEVGAGIPVEPMLALQAWQYRVPLVQQKVHSANAVTMSSVDRFRFCIGMLPSDLQSGISTTRGFGRGVNEIEIRVGTVGGLPVEHIKIPVESLNITSPADGVATVEVGRNVRITARVQPNNATNINLVWRSGSPEVATVSSDGVVTGVAPGEAIITAAAEGNPLAVAGAVVTVIPAGHVDVTGIRLDRSEASVGIGSSIQLTPTILPADATNRTVSWVSGDPDIAYVDAYGSVTGRGVGTATITAQADEGEFTAVAAITVVYEDITVTGITLNQSEGFVERNGSLELVPAIAPVNATNINVFWSSNMPGVASVDTDGTVMGRGTGSAVITAETEDGGFTAYFNVTVVPEGTDITAYLQERAAAQRINLRFVIDSTSFTINGAPGRLDVAPFIQDNRTMVPIRAVSESLGATVTFDGETQTVHIELDNQNIALPIGEIIPGLDVPAVIIEARTFVPLRFVMETFGAEVVWDGDAMAVYISRG